MGTGLQNGRAPVRSRATSPVDLQARDHSRARRRPAALEYRVLGPFEMLRDGAEILPQAAARERAVLLCLVIRSGEVVSAERLIDSVWGEQAPRCAANALQNCVSHLRKELESRACAKATEVLLSRPPGYVLQVEDQQLDSARAETLLDRSIVCCKRGALQQAARLLRRAEKLWRGPALVDFSYEDFAQAEIARLDELRLVTVAERVEVELRIGATPSSSASSRGSSERTRSTSGSAAS